MYYLSSSHNIVVWKTRIENSVKKAVAWVGSANDGSMTFSNYNAISMWAQIKLDSNINILIENVNMFYTNQNLRIKNKALLVFREIVELLAIMLLELRINNQSHFRENLVLNAFNRFHLIAWF